MYIPSNSLNFLHTMDVSLTHAEIAKVPEQTKIGSYGNM